MKRIMTHIKFDVYQKLVKDKVFDDPWHVMFQAALDTLKNEYLAELIIAIDWRAALSQKIGKTTILIIKEYVKRVQNFEAAQEKLEAEKNRLQAEARARIQKERIKDNQSYIEINWKDKKEEAAINLLREIDDVITKMRKP